MRMLSQTRSALIFFSSILSINIVMSLNAGQTHLELIRNEGRDKHRVDHPFLPSKIPTGYEAVDEGGRIIAHFSAIGLRRAVIKMLCIFGYDAIKSAMGSAGGVATSERVLATVTALVSLNLFAPDTLLIWLIVFIAAMGPCATSRREHRDRHLERTSD